MKMCWEVYAKCDWGSNIQENNNKTGFRLFSVPENILGKTLKDILVGKVVYLIIQMGRFT